MQLHVLAGCHDLMRPDGCSTRRVGRPDRRPGPRRHRVLALVALRAVLSRLPARPPEDRRVKVFATSLCENFGSRFEPLVVAARVPRGGPRTAPSARARRNGPALGARHRRRDPPASAGRRDPRACARPAGRGRSRRLLDRAGARTSPTRSRRLDALRAACRARGFPEGSPSCAVIEVVPGLPQAALLIRNAMAPPIAERIVARLAREEGLVPDRVRGGERRARGPRQNGARRGLAPALSADARQLDRLADKVLRTLLARCPVPQEERVLGPDRALRPAPARDPRPSDAAE